MRPNKRQNQQDRLVAYQRPWVHGRRVICSCCSFLILASSELFGNGFSVRSRDSVFTWRDKTGDAHIRNILSVFGLILLHSQQLYVTMILMGHSVCNNNIILSTQAKLTNAVLVNHPVVWCHQWHFKFNDIPACVLVGGCKQRANEPFRRKLRHWSPRQKKWSGCNGFNMGHFISTFWNNTFYGCLNVECAYVQKSKTAT